MIKLIFKLIIIVILCTSTFLAKAQLGYDYAQYDVGVAVGLNVPVSTDVHTLNKTPSAHFNFTYNQSPFVNYVFEGQAGRLKGSDPESIQSGRRFENHFAAFALKVQLQAGEVIDYSHNQMANAFKNLYVSTGIGYIVNHIVVKDPDLRVPPGMMLAGDNNTQVPFIPVRLGYEIKVFNQYNEPSIKIDLGYQYNFVLSDNLDGYDTGDSKRDVFSQLTLGVKFAIGGVTSYRKQVHY